jgi:small-conductance mechanosensitive channel
MITGRNLTRVEGWLGGANTGLLIAAGVIGLAIGIWWWRTRMEP